MTKQLGAAFYVKALTGDLNRALDAICTGRPEEAEEPARLCLRGMGLVADDGDLTDLGESVRNLRCQAPRPLI